MQCASSTTSRAIRARPRAARNGALASRSGATYTRRSRPAARSVSTAARSGPPRPECTAAAARPRDLRPSTWSFMSAMSGDTTTVVPSSRSAGSWKQSDFPDPVGMTATRSRPSKTAAAASCCPGRNRSKPNRSWRAAWRRPLPSTPDGVITDVPRDGIGSRTRGSERSYLIGPPLRAGILWRSRRRCCAAAFALVDRVISCAASCQEKGEGPRARNMARIDSHEGIPSRAGARRAPEPYVLMEPDPLAAALSRIARAVSETLELKDVFARVAEAAATVLPFDTMGVTRLETPDTVRRYAVAGRFVPEDLSRVFSLEDFSPAIRPQVGSVERIDEATIQLDPSFPVDGEILRQGVRSLLRLLLLTRGRLAGTVWFASARPGAFTAEHQAILKPIADLLALALEHERLWDLDAARRRRLDAIDALLLTMAGSLDVRDIFNRVSEIGKPVLPHDRLMLTSLSPDRREITVDAVSGDPVPDLPTRMPAGDPAHCQHGREYVLIPDVEDEAEACSRARPACRLLGIRSLLKIQLRLDGGFGWLLFLSRVPRPYSEEDVVLARPVADHVSLALSHQRLAQEERRAAEAGERAARLEERVEALGDELETTRGYRRVVGESKKWKAVLTH